MLAVLPPMRLALPAPVVPTELLSGTPGKTTEPTDLLAALKANFISTEAKLLDRADLIARILGQKLKVTIRSRLQHRPNGTRTEMVLLDESRLTDKIKSWGFDIEKSAVYEAAQVGELFPKGIASPEHSYNFHCEINRVLQPGIRKDRLVADATPQKVLAAVIEAQAAARRIGKRFGRAEIRTCIVEKFYKEQHRTDAVMDDGEAEARAEQRIKEVTAALNGNTSDLAKLAKGLPIYQVDAANEDAVYFVVAESMAAAQQFIKGEHTLKQIGDIDLKAGAYSLTRLTADELERHVPRDTQPKT